MTHRSPVTITRRIEWDMGHRLGDGYPSRCRHAHGHRYAAEVSFTAPTLDDHGMVLDFGDIKRLAARWIDDHLDHAFLVCQRDHRLLEFLRAERSRHYVVDFNTTVENIAGWLGPTLQEVVDADRTAYERRVRLTHLRLYETPNCWADWTSAPPPSTPA